MLQTGTVFVTSQTPARPALNASTRRPSGLNFACIFHIHTCIVRAARFHVCSGWPVVTLHKRTFPSRQAVTIKLPSGLNAALHTGPECFSVSSSAPEAASQIRAVPSPLAVTTRPPSTSLRSRALEVQQCSAWHDS